MKRLIIALFLVNSGALLAPPKYDFLCINGFRYIVLYRNGLPAGLTLELDKDRKPIACEM